MWRLAEKVKIEFFNTIKVQFDFNSQEIKELLITSENDYLYINCNGKIERKKNPLDNIRVTNKDVERIICGDIYSLLFGLMKDGVLSDGEGKERRVDEFDYYKLSGQSCKIPMFKELLKEYIPGRKLRPYSENKSDTGNNSETLKLECLDGCIKFIKDQRGAELHVIPKIEKPKIIYNIYVKNSHSDSGLIFNPVNLEKVIYKQFAPSSTEMSFDIIRIGSSNNNVERSLKLLLNDKYTRDYQSASELKSFICKKYSYDDEYMDNVFRGMTKEFDKINEMSKMLFCIPSPDNYGVMFFVVQHIKENGADNYKLLSVTSVPFENADKTFFDGNR